MQRGYATTPHGHAAYLKASEGPPPPLLALAGRSARVFDGLIRLLAPDFRIIAVDMFGCGHSDPIAVTASEDSQVGRQGEALLKIVPNAQLALIREAEGPKHAVTLIEHYPQIARLVRSFIQTGTARD